MCIICYVFIFLLNNNTLAISALLEDLVLITAAETGTVTSADILYFQSFHGSEKKNFNIEVTQAGS